jgi:tetratricopeptide (TPR) repeat protein
MAQGGGTNRFSALLLEGLDHYRKGRMLDAVRAWEEAYLLEPTNLRAREFLRSALERIHAVMSPANKTANPGTAAPPPHPWLPSQPPAATPAPAAPPLAAPARNPPPPVAAAAPAPAKKPVPSPKPPSAPPRKPGPPAPPRSPWDEGPSLAIPQAEITGEGGNGAWSIHRDKAPAETVPDDETNVWMRGARELVALNDFSGALELLQKLLERKPNDADALKLHGTCEHNLTLMFESKIGAMDARPRTAIAPDEIIWLNLDPRAGFVLAQIDGEVSFDDLYAICGLKRLDTARILCELLEQGVVQVEGRDQAVAKRAMPRS